MSTRWLVVMEGGGEGVTSNELISVTQALGPFVDFSKIPENVLAYATARGTEVHRICAALAQGLWVPRIPTECAGYVESFWGWFKSVVAEVIFVERRFHCCCYQYVGHPDLVVRIVQDSGLTVVDLKTPITEAPTWKAQNAAYKHLVECCENAPVSRCGSLKLHPQGGMAKLIEHTENSAADFNAFLAALTATRYFRG